MRRKLAVLVTAFSLVLPLALAAAASAAKIQTNHDPTADFASYKTYRWNKAEGPGGSGLDRPVRAAAEEALAKKGLKKVEVGGPADLELMYNAGGVSNLTAGIAFTFHEMATDKVAWSGWKIAKGTNQNAPPVMVKRAPGDTKDICAKYPPK